MIGYMRDTPQRGYIYGLSCTCHDEGYRYVGKTFTRKPGNRMRSHRYNARRGVDLPVYKWMRKHGVENIVSTILCETETNDELILKEIETIAQLKTHVSEGGLNCTRGGDGSLGWKQTPESIAKANAARAKTRGYEGRRPRKPRPHMSPEQRYQSIFNSRARGDDSGTSKLTSDQVREIKDRIWSGERQKSLAQEFGVTGGNISAIATDRTWKHIPWPSDRDRIIIDHQKIGRDAFLASDANPFRKHAS